MYKCTWYLGPVKGTCIIYCVTQHGGGYVRCTARLRMALSMSMLYIIYYSAAQHGATSGRWASRRAADGRTPRQGQYFGKKKNLQKISYFEIRWLLKELNFEEIKAKGRSCLGDLLDKIKKRWIWQNLPVLEPKHWDEVEISLPLEKADIKRVKEYNSSTKLANEAYDNKQYNIALAHFFNALNITPKSPYILESIGNSFSGLRRFDDAENYYNQAINIIPDSYHVLLNSAANYIDNKKYDEYVEQLLNIMKLYGDYPLIRCRIKNSIDRLYHLGDIQKLKAKQAFEKKWKEYQFYDFDGCNDLLKSMMSFLFQ